MGEGERVSKNGHIPEGAPRLTGDTDAMQDTNITAIARTLTHTHTHTHAHKHNVFHTNVCPHEADSPNTKYYFSNSWKKSGASALWIQFPHCDSQQVVFALQPLSKTGITMRFTFTIRFRYLAQRLGTL